MRLNDMIIAERIINGEIMAYEELINTHRTRVFNYCLGFVGDYHIAEDLA